MTLIGYSVLRILMASSLLSASPVSAAVAEKLQERLRNMGIADGPLIARSLMTQLHANSVQALLDLKDQGTPTIVISLSSPLISLRPPWLVNVLVLNL